MKLIDVTVSRFIAGSPAEVFDVWLDPASPGCPWHGAKKIISSPVVDGLFYWGHENAGRLMPHYGRFVTIDRPRCAEYTWVSEATKGVESIVAVSFEPRGDQTEVTLRHSGVPDDDMGRKHEEGWTWFLSMLAERFAKK